LLQIAKIIKVPAEQLISDNSFVQNNYNNKENKAAQNYYENKDLVDTLKDEIKYLKQQFIQKDTQINKLQENKK